MTAYNWFTVVQAVVMALAAVLVAAVYRGFQTGRWSASMDKSKEIEALRKEDDAIRADLGQALAEFRREVLERFDRAGNETSKLASRVQGMDSRLRGEFVIREVYALGELQAKEARADLSERIRRLERLADDNGRNR